MATFFDSQQGRFKKRYGTFVPNDPSSWVGVLLRSQKNSDTLVQHEEVLPRHQGSRMGWIHTPSQGSWLEWNLMDCCDQLIWNKKGTTYIIYNIYILIYTISVDYLLLYYRDYNKLRCIGCPITKRYTKPV